MQSRAKAVNPTRVQGKSTFLPGETCRPAIKVTLTVMSGWGGRSQQKPQYHCCRGGKGRTSRRWVSWAARKISKEDRKPQVEALACKRSGWSPWELHGGSSYLRCETEENPAQNYLRHSWWTAGCGPACPVVWEEAVSRCLLLDCYEQYRAITTKFLLFTFPGGWIYGNPNPARSF